MSSSDDVKELVTALSKAQRMMKPAIKDTPNPFFKSKYADLASVWEACREPLGAHGLSIVQAGHVLDGIQYLTTTLFHSSGQWINSTYPIPIGDGKPQSVASANTYIRRIALMGLVGIAPEDDDGNQAQVAHHAATPKPVTSTPSQQAAPAPKPRPGGLTDKQIARLFAIAKEHKWTNEQMKEYMTAAFGITTTSDLTKTNYDLLCGVIEKTSYLLAMNEMAGSAADVDMAPVGMQNSFHGGTQNEMYTGDLPASH